MVKNYDINGTEKIRLVTSTQGLIAGYGGQQAIALLLKQGKSVQW